MNDWKETTLNNVVDINISSIGEKFSFSEILYLDTGSITEGKIDSFQILKLSDAPSRAKRLVKHGDVLYSTVRPNLKHYGYINSPENNLVVSTGFAVISSKLNKLNSKFLYYWLTQFEITAYLHQLAEQSTSTYPSIKPNDIGDLVINLPPLSEQKAIANVLTSFDNKIELLQQQNQTLETIAQTIFAAWFGKYKVDDELPKGWRVFSLDELVNSINGYSYKGIELVAESNHALVTLKSFDRNGGFQTRGFKPFKGNPKISQEVKVGDLVVAHTDLTQDAEVLGNPAFIFDDGGFDKMYITMDLVKVIPKKEEITNGFLYYLMKTRTFKGHCKGYSNGTTVLHLNKKAIPEYEIVLPEDFELVKSFSNVAKETTNKISINNAQIQSLTKTRDTLLPKLMSGALRVSEVKTSTN